MPVGARIDQLRVDAHTIAGLLNTSFHHMRHTELLTDHAYVAQHPAFVWHHTRPADHFQIGHFREVTQDLVLHAIGEKSVLFVVTEILERQDGDRFLRRTLCDWLHRHWLL